MGGDVKRCRVCGKLFTSLGSKICYDCSRKKDEVYGIVRDYIYDNPNAGVVEISKETGIDSKLILDFLREGRISINSDNITLKCANCGVSITEGRYCQKCKLILAKQLEAIEGTVDVNQSHEDDINKKTVHRRMHLKI